jgi:hypothetical protein
MITQSERIEFGDFQTPPALANRVVQLLSFQGLTPRTVLEPTCGLGSFVQASLSGFREQAAVVAYDVNPDYVQKTASLKRLSSTQGRLSCHVGNFFAQDWTATLKSLPEPILIIGNPPWVTASALGSLGSPNLPEKTNFQNRRGLDALTGKSNFDVAEWMLLKLIDAGRDRDVTLAMLVKTSVARRVLAHLWRTGASVEAASIYRFDAPAHFGVSADACLFCCRLGRRSTLECPVADLGRPDLPIGRVGWRDGALVSDPLAYDRQKSLVVSESGSPSLRWRSGVKHDCSAVMELRRATTGGFVNGNDQHVELEPEYVYPLLKGTDLVHGRVAEVRRWLLITQGRPGEDTSIIARRAPKTWAYLCAHGEQLDSRRSSIYRNRPRFSVFGVGPYTFAPWKVAISALHKRLAFAIAGPIEGRPVIFDDTCYHLSCDSESGAQLLAALLNSDCSRELLGSMIFWDAKRPITAEILQRLDLRRAAARLSLAAEFAKFEGGFRPSSPQAQLDFGPANCCL